MLKIQICRPRYKISGKELHKKHEKICVKSWQEFSEINTGLFIAFFNHISTEQELPLYLCSNQTRSHKINHWEWEIRHSMNDRRKKPPKIWCWYPKKHQRRISCRIFQGKSLWVLSQTFLAIHWHPKFCTNDELIFFIEKYWHSVSCYTRGRV